jgi:hypothetical protein
MGSPRWTNSVLWRAATLPTKGQSSTSALAMGAQATTLVIAIGSM